MGPRSLIQGATIVALIPLRKFHPSLILSGPLIIIDWHDNEGHTRPEAHPKE